MPSTLARSVKRALLNAFEDALERTRPKRAILFYCQEKGKPSVEKDFGFSQTPSLSSPDVDHKLVSACLSKAQTFRHTVSERSVLCVPICRPPEKTVLGALYLETELLDRGSQEDQAIAIEALASKAGAEVAILQKRLVCQAERVLPTPEELEEWSGIRRAGLEAFKAGVSDMATSFLERAKGIAEGWGPCRELAASLNEYGQVLAASGRLKEGVEQFERGLVVLEQAGMERHAQAIPLLNNLGGAHHSQGELEEAAGLYRLCVDIMTEQEKESLATPAVMANLGVVSKEMGDIPTARVWLQQALSAATRLFGEDHPNTAKCQAKLDEL